MALVQQQCPEEGTDHEVEAQPLAERTEGQHEHHLFAVDGILDLHGLTVRQESVIGGHRRVPGRHGRRDDAVVEGSPVRRGQSACSRGPGSYQCLIGR